MLNVQPGTNLGGRYEVIRSIGAGGMGAVYLACDTRYRDFFVALKVLYPGIIKTKESRERFRNEIVASYRVNHINIVRAFEYFDEDDFQAYAMEYVDGGDLAEKMNGGKLSWVVATNILKQIAAGLEAIHAQGVVHRDLKPENILLTKAGIVKISDFGVARLRGSITLTQAGAMVGTPKYVSPEYVETGECDHRGDIYALGVMAFELLTGESPFRSDTKVSLMLERFNIDLTKLQEIGPDCPPALIKIVTKALSVSLEGRYQSAKQLWEDLDALERGDDPFAEASQGQTDSAGNIVAPVSQNIELLRSGALKLGFLEKNKVRLVIGFCAVLIAFVTYSFFFAGTGMSISSLPLGSYSGIARGVFADDSINPFKLWKTSKGEFILLGKTHCSVEKVDEQGRFGCGDLKFELTLSTLEKNSAAGSLRELGWNTAGTWSLSEIP